MGSFVDRLPTVIPTAPSGEQGADGYEGSRATHFLHFIDTKERNQSLRMILGALLLRTFRDDVTAVACNVAAINRGRRGIRYGAQ